MGAGEIATNPSPVHARPVSPQVGHRSTTAPTGSIAAPPPSADEARQADVGVSAGHVANARLGEAWAGAAGTQAAASAQPRYGAAEAGAREQIVQNMLRGMDPPPSDAMRGRISNATDAFSLGQLQKMDKGGVRFWGAAGLPPEMDMAEAPMLHTPGRFLPGVRVIQMREGASTEAVRHELAHAWDDVRNDKKLQSLDALPEARRGPELERRLQEKYGMASESPERLRTQEVGTDGKTHAVQLSMTEMMQRYRANTPRRELGFENPGTREGYAMQNPREFYAEGYSVFHGNSDSAKTRLLHRAPELYSRLEGEARTSGLPVPDRNALEARWKADEGR